MTSSLRSHLIGAVVTAVAALVLTVVLVEDPLVEHRALASSRTQLVRSARLALRRLAAEPEAADQIADQVGARRGVHLTIVNARNQVVGDSALQKAQLSGATAPSELLPEAREKGFAWSLPNKRTSRPRVMTVAVAGPNQQVVVARHPLWTVQITRNAVREMLITGGAVAVLIGALLILALSQMWVRPVAQLTKTAHALASGNLSFRTDSTRSDELGTLGRALDDMANQLSSQLHRLEVEKARLRTTLDAMADAVFVTDERGRIALANRALHRLVPTEVHAKAAHRVIESDALRSSVEQALQGKPSDAQLEVQVANARYNFVAAVAPLPNREGAVVVLHDVTALKQSDRIRRDFVANASHELRTPLTAIRGFAETLRDGAIEQPDTGRRFVDTIVQHTLRLQRLVDDLLALSRAESLDEPLELSTVDVHCAAREVLEGLETQARAKNVTLTTCFDPQAAFAEASAHALDQILVNLVDNAIKYNHPSGEVTVRTEVEGQAIWIHVEDTGPGIAASELPRIFERFYRVDKGRSRAMGGTGLGLSIVKHLAARVGGEVNAESKLGEGSVFSIRLRRARA